MHPSRTVSAATAAIAVAAALTLAADATVADASSHPGQHRAGHTQQFEQPTAPDRADASGAAKVVHTAAGRAPSKTPKAPSRQPLTENAHTLHHVGQVLRPVSELLTAVLHEDGPRLEAREADQRRAQIHRALGTLRAATPARAVSPRTAADSTTLVQRATDRLERRTEELLRAAGDDDRARVDRAAEATLTSAMDLLAALTAGGNLPTATMPGLPSLPAAQTQAKVPEAPSGHRDHADQDGARQTRPLSS